METPTSAGQTFTFDDVTYTTIAVIPLSAGGGYRVPARQEQTEEDPLLTTRTFIFLENEEPFPIPRPVHWETATEPYACPLASELRPGDTLPPAAGKPGRPNLHRDDGDIRSIQVVSSVAYDPFRGSIQLVTRDAQGLVRRYHRSPDEAVDFSKPYVRKTRTAPKYRRAMQPETYEGPITSPTGAQFVFRSRSTRGGRIPKSAPVYDNTLPPQFADNGDLLPYIVMAPSHREEIDGLPGSVHMFSPTARQLPQVQWLLRAAGLLPSEEEPAS